MPGWKTQYADLDRAVQDAKEALDIMVKERDRIAVGIENNEDEWTPASSILGDQIAKVVRLSYDFRRDVEEYLG